MTDEFLTIPAQLDGFELKAYCSRCRTVVAPTPFDQIHICLQCTQLYSVQFPESLELLSFETQVYYGIMKDLIKGPTTNNEKNKRKDLLDLLIRLGARVNKL
jgi:hypothetical protein